MSSSNGAGGGDGPVFLGTGRVIMGTGASGPGETTIQELEGKKRPVWDMRTNDELLARVRDKAREQAREIILAAQAEAEEIKRKAYEEGAAQGLAEAQQNYAEQLADMAGRFAGLLGKLEASAREVWEARRPDVEILVKLTVEKTLNIEMAERRQEILAALLDECLELIDSRRRLCVVVGPTDQELVQVVLQQAQAAHPDLTSWRVRVDPAMGEGLTVECDESRVENTIEARFSGVEAILNRLAVEPEASEGAE